MGWFNSFVEAITADAGATVMLLMTWWLHTPSPLQQIARDPLTLGLVGSIAVLILMVSMFWQVGRLMISGRKEPLVEAAFGLMKFAVINAAALMVIDISLKAADSLSAMLILETGIQLAERLQAAFEAVDMPPFMRMFVASSFVGFSMLQWLLLLFRQAGILVLIALLPLAAAGVISSGTRQWFPTLVGWLIGLVVYKPVAALIYAIGMGLFAEGDDLVTILTGLVVLLLAVLALPVVMNFFKWAQLGVSGGGSIGGALAAGATGAVAIGALGASRQQEMTGPGSAPGWAAGAGGEAPAGTGGGQRLLPPGGSQQSGGAHSGGPAPSGGDSPGGPDPSGSGSSGGGRGKAPAGGAGGQGGTGSSHGAPAAPAPPGGVPAGAAAGGAGAGAAAAGAGPGAAAVTAAAKGAAKVGREAAETFTSPPDDSGARSSKGPDGAGPAPGGNTNR